MYIRGFQHHEDSNEICGLCYCVPVYMVLLPSQILSHALSALSQAGLIGVFLQIEEIHCDISEAREMRFLLLRPSMW